MAHPGGGEAGLEASSGRPDAAALGSDWPGLQGARTEKEPWSSGRFSAPGTGSPGPQSSCSASGSRGRGRGGHSSGHFPVAEATSLSLREGVLQARGLLGPLCAIRRGTGETVRPPPAGGPGAALEEGAPGQDGSRCPGTVQHQEQMVRVDRAEGPVQKTPVAPAPSSWGWPCPRVLVRGGAVAVPLSRCPCGKLRRVPGPLVPSWTGGQ